MKEIFCLVEHEEGKIKDITLEALSLARELQSRCEAQLQSRCEAQLAEKFSLSVTAGLFAPDERLLSEVSSLFDETLFIADPLFSDFNSESFVDYLLWALKERKPNFILIGHNSFGVEIAPYLAAKLSYGFIPDIIGYEIVDSNLYFRHEFYGGKIIALLSSPKERILLTLRSGAFKPKEIKTVSGKVTQLKREGFHPKTRVLGYKEQPTGDVDITKADIVVGIGRGIKDKANLSLVEEFAKEIGGVIACSRPIVDYGWLPKDRLVGSSGKTIKPKIYLALGISGAFQHLSGVKDAEMIIAVNKDAEAPIFSCAHYGVVGDLLKILPALKEKIKEIKS